MSRVATHTRAGVGSPAGGALPENDPYAAFVASLGDAPSATSGGTIASGSVTSLPSARR